MNNDCFCLFLKNSQYFPNFRVYSPNFPDLLQFLETCWFFSTLDVHQEWGPNPSSFNSIFVCEKPCSEAPLVENKVIPKTGT